jgi:hypothetical protein
MCLAAATEIDTAISEFSRGIRLNSQKELLVQDAEEE